MPIANLGKVRGDDGANVYIKYNSVAADAGAVDNFSSGTHKFIGMMTSTSKTKPVSGYTWGKFVGDDGNPGNPGAPGTNGRDGTNGTNGTNGADGKNCYIKYSTTNNITGATDTWTQGQTWIGFALSNSQTIPTDNASYKWSKLIDDSIRMSINTASINISASSSTYYYLGQTVSGTISGMAEVILTNCAGTVTISGNTAKIYVVNSPALTIAGKTASNWRNIYRDGKAEYLFVNSYIRVGNSNNDMSSKSIYKPTGGIQENDFITLQLCHGYPDYGDGMRLVTRLGGYYAHSYVVRNGNWSNEARTYSIGFDTAGTQYISGNGSLRNNETVDLTYFKLERFLEV